MQAALADDCDSAAMAAAQLKGGAGDPLAGLTGRALAAAAAKHVALPLLAWAFCVAAALLGDAAGARSGLAAAISVAGGEAAAGRALSFAYN